MSLGTRVSDRSCQLLLKQCLSLFIAITIFSSESNGEKYIGCYRDISESVKLMNDGHKLFPGKLTKELCIQFCTSQNTNFAGLQYGSECFCSRNKPPHMYVANSTACSMKCEGDRRQICGERLHLSVYNIFGREFVKHDKEYIGCFEDDVDNRMLNGRMWEFLSMLTPDYCMGHCWRNGYKYAGLQYGTECHCGDSFREEHRVDEEECTTPCSGDLRINCGSGLRMSVYSTGITDISEANKLIGCFEDAEHVRVLSGLQLTLVENNSARRCLNLCNSLGFKYSGVEFKIECACGNRRPAATLMVGENECAIPCPDDDTAQCGGNYRLLVYSTNNLEPAPVPIKRPSITQKNNRTTEKPVVTSCKKSVTIANGRTVCRGSVVFLEDFERPLQRTRWFHSVLMPWAPDFEFVVFTNKQENSFVKDGKLVIKPSLMEQGFVRRGKLTLKDCTGDPFTEECERKAISYSILPPVESARVNTKESFSFKYGRVDIRAKLPEGDWLYPELWLEPKRKIYGRDYVSGRIRIAGARGNRELRFKGKEVGGVLLESGVLLGAQTDVKARTVERRAQQLWSNAFHNYTVIWSPENIWFMVDGLVKQEILPPSGQKLYELMGFQNITETWKGSNVLVAPFDQECYLSIGLSVGGIRNFPDNSTSKDYNKPWANEATKAMANFFRARDDWIRTWSEESSLLKVDSIKVTAL